MRYLDDKTWTNETFLGYCEEHSKTPRALFHKNMIAEMCFLHGDEELAEAWAKSVIRFRSVDFSDWIADIKAKNK